MKQDIIFHIAPERRWQEAQQGGFYEPESLEERGYIPCSAGSQLQPFINNVFEGERKMMLIVIDCSTLQPKVQFRKTDLFDEEIPCIEGALNLDAVLDRIKLRPNPEGHFELNFKSDG
ncbi:MAG: DUF952 domain-containing protein [Balneolaceae bacterium]|nr:DUF952 domain-containing protein [Balneolaceae bacterium]